MDGKTLAQKTWGSSPTGWTAAKEFEPGTREFFEKAITNRRTYEMPWLPEVAPFAQSRDRSVIEIGFGPGYDALTFLESGADYHGIDITPENVERTRKHLGLYGFAPDVQQGDAENLPFSDASFDIAFSNGVLHHVPDMARAFSEAYRVLKPGGQATFILYNKNSLFYRVTLDLWQGRLLGGNRETSLDDRLRGIEANEAGEKPLVRVYTPNDCKRLMLEAGFAPPHTQVRKLVWEDLPYVPALKSLYPRLPKALLGWFGRRWGWYVIVSARKPIRS